jgi:hypothetical protein
LYNSGAIDKKVFSIFISKKPEYKSAVTFGNYNLNYAVIQGNTSIFWVDITNTQYWSLKLVSAKLGDRQIKLSTNSAIVDSGTSYLLMPSSKE